jgi:hypothetical protein
MNHTAKKHIPLKRRFLQNQHTATSQNTELFLLYFICD